MFRPGDRVRCIDETDGLEEGKVYTVRSMSTTGRYVRLMEHDESHGGYLLRRFELVVREANPLVLRCLTILRDTTNDPAVWEDCKKAIASLQKDAGATS